MDEVRTHSSPFQKSEYSNLIQTIRGPQQDVMDTKPPAVDAPPSIYHLVHGKTYLSDALQFNDNDKSPLVNDFILAKMKDEKIRNNEEGYKAILRGVLKEVGLTDKHDGQTIVESIYQRFLDRTMTAKDYLLFLNVLANRGLKLG